MIVDPSDDTTFWFTGEWGDSGTGAWNTRIGAFAFDGSAAGVAIVEENGDLVVDEIDPTAGTYTVGVRVTDDDGGSHTDTATVEVAAIAALNDIEFLQQTLDLVHNELEFMYDALDKRKVPYIRSQANFFMVQVGDGRTADAVFENLLKQGVIVRSMTAYGYSGYIRVNIGRHEENIRFLEALEKVI